MSKELLEMILSMGIEHLPLITVCWCLAVLVGKSKNDK